MGPPGRCGMAGAPGRAGPRYKGWPGPAGLGVRAKAPGRRGCGAPGVAGRGCCCCASLAIRSGRGGTTGRGCGWPTKGPRGGMGRAGPGVAPVWPPCGALAIPVDGRCTKGRDSGAPGVTRGAAVVAPEVTPEVVPAGKGWRGPVNTCPGRGAVGNGLAGGGAGRAGPGVAAAGRGVKCEGVTSGVWAGRAGGGGACGRAPPGCGERRDASGGRSGAMRGAGFSASTGFSASGGAASGWAGGTCASTTGAGFTGSAGAGAGRSGSAATGWASGWWCSASSGSASVPLRSPVYSPRKKRRNFSATSSSTELECVFFSVTPSSGSLSRIRWALISRSRASSLMRIFFIDKTIAMTAEGGQRDWNQQLHCSLLLTLNISPALISTHTIKKWAVRPLFFAKTSLARFMPQGVSSALAHRRGGQFQAHLMPRGHVVGGEQDGRFLQRHHDVGVPLVLVDHGGLPGGVGWHAADVGVDD